MTKLEAAALQAMRKWAVSEVFATDCRQVRDKIRNKFEHASANNDWIQAEEDEARDHNAMLEAARELLK